MEKLEISSVEVSQSDSIGVYKMANGYQMIDGDTSTSGIVYLEEYILSVSFSLEVKLKDKAEVHAGLYTRRTIVRRVYSRMRLS